MSDCDSEDDATDKQLKIVILGDSATGKVRKENILKNTDRFLVLLRIYFYLQVVFLCFN